MAMRIRVWRVRLHDANGTLYTASVWGAPRPDGLWLGWIEFVSEGGQQFRRTGPETTQSSLDALEYWVAGLEPAYYEGAFDRAQERAFAFPARPGAVL